MTSCPTPLGQTDRCFALAVWLRWRSSLPRGAAAFYGYGAQIVSADFARGEQGDDATVFAAISADGRYVAIQTRARNFFADDDPDPPGEYRAGGVFRFDLETQALEKVADGDLFDEADNSFLRRGASNPSISADGRYVAFATAEPLVAADSNDHVDVYVRDMDVADRGAGRLRPRLRPGRGRRRGRLRPAFGADSRAANRAATSPAGWRSPPTAAGSPSAPTRRPTCRRAAPSTSPPGRSSSATGSPTRPPWSPPNATRKREMTAAPAGGALGAALSGDGTTVAWTGGNAGDQTRFLGGERPIRASPTTSGDGSPTGPTRRPGGSPASPTPTTPPARQGPTATSTRARPAPATAR